MKLSNHFSRKEFECKCGCGFNVVDIELLSVLESIRNYFNKPVKITSACRCKSHNTKVGGKPKSKHLLGIAADIVVSDVDAGDVYSFIDKYSQNKYGIGKYDSFTHIDVREKKARW